MPAAATSTATSALPLAVQDVSRRYGRRWALARLSLELQPGSSLLLTGHNGSGKTTLLKVISTVLSPTAGKVKVFGLDTVVDRDEVRHKVALLSHNSYLYEDLTAEQNLTVLARLLGKDAPKDVAAELLGRVGLTSRSANPVRQFSAGMRKRLAIARLLMKKPELALFDEPFGELDPAGIDQMEKLIHELRDGGTSLILATHLVEQGLTLCKQRLHLHEGRAVSA